LGGKLPERPKKEGTREGWGGERAGALHDGKGGTSEVDYHYYGEETDRKGPTEGRKHGGIEEGGGGTTKT